MIKIKLIFNNIIHNLIVQNKFYLNSIQAFIADKNLDILDQKKQKLKNIRDIYNSEFGLNNTSDHLYRIEVDDNKKFIDISKQNKIIHGIHYEAQHLNNVYKPYSTNSLCPNSEKISKITVSIPFHENLSEQDLNHVIKNLKKYELSKS